MSSVNNCNCNRSRKDALTFSGFPCISGLIKIYANFKISNRYMAFMLLYRSRCYTSRSCLKLRWNVSLLSRMFLISPKLWSSLWMVWELKIIQNICGYNTQKYSCWPFVWEAMFLGLDMFRAHTSQRHWPGRANPPLSFWRGAIESLFITKLGCWKSMDRMCLWT